jgi:hypothetical protein
MGIWALFGPLESHMHACAHALLQSHALQLTNAVASTANVAVVTAADIAAAAVAIAASAPPLLQVQPLPSGAASESPSSSDRLRGSCPSDNADVCFAGTAIVTSGLGPEDHSIVAI